MVGQILARLGLMLQAEALLSYCNSSEILPNLSPLPQAHLVPLYSLWDPVRTLSIHLPPMQVSEGFFSNTKQTDSHLAFQSHLLLTMYP